MRVVMIPIGDTVEQRVEEGFPWVLENWPSLIKNVNLKTLDMADNCHCLIGQTYGSFETGVSEMGLTFEEAIKYGLSTDMGDDLDLKDFTPVWKEKIAAWRKEQA